MTATPPGGRLCARTGLVLLPAGHDIAWRVAKTAYGPLNPQLRPGSADAEPASWGRFDTRGGRTLYAAATRECAFAEVLAHHRRRLGQRDSLARDGAFLGIQPARLAAEVEQEWVQRGHMRPGHLPKGWRTERTLYRLALPHTGWWVLLEHPDSMAAAEAALGEQLASVGVSELDVAVLRGGNRDATVALADWVRALVLDDGSRAHGIRFASRHATGDAWAFWLRRIDDGADVGAEPVRVLGALPIAVGDDDLATVAGRMGLTLW